VDDDLSGFRDRVDAGARLAALLSDERGAPLLVLGLPRGGVIVAAEVARALHAPLDVFMARKLGAPDDPEVGMGAIAEGGALALDERTLRAFHVGARALRGIVERELVELQRRVSVYRRGELPPRLEGKTVIVVDDGVATGGTAEAALDGVSSQGPTRVVLAVPVGAEEALERLRGHCDRVVCVLRRRDLRSVGGWYDEFPQVTDDEVLAALDASQRVSGRAALHRSSVSAKMAP
jgi:putative phosphoribosyl transferase